MTFKWSGVAHTHIDQGIEDKHIEISSATRSNMNNHHDRNLYLLEKDKRMQILDQH